MDDGGLLFNVIETHNAMAFGTFFKKIITGAKNFINKAAPIVRKGLETVSKIAPTIGNAIGGPIGGIVNTVGNLAGKGAQLMDKTGLSEGVSGLKGRFNMPLLKTGS